MNDESDIILTDKGLINSLLPDIYEKDIVKKIIETYGLKMYSEGAISIIVSEGDIPENCIIFALSG